MKGPLTMQISMRAQRVNIGLTQQELAARAGISLAKYQRIEANPARMRLGELNHIAEAMGLEPVSLFLSALSSFSGAYEDGPSPRGPGSSTPHAEPSPVPTHT